MRKSYKVRKFRLNGRDNRHARSVQTERRAARQMKENHRNG